MKCENGTNLTMLTGDTGTVHIWVRTPKGNQYIDIDIDENNEVKITKNHKTWEK